MKNRLIFPKNWPKYGERGKYWKEQEVQKNICPKCHCYGGRFSHDGWCQFCGYDSRKEVKTMAKQHTDATKKKISKSVRKAAEKKKREANPTWIEKARRSIEKEIKILDKEINRLHVLEEKRAALEDVLAGLSQYE